MLVQAILSETVALTAAWQSAFAALGQLPMLPTLVIVALAAAMLSWFSWQAGSRPKQRGV